MTWLGQARKRNQRLGSIAYDAGTNTPRRLDLRNAGYLSRLRLTQTATFIYATAGPTGVDAMGQYGGYLSRITVLANSVGNLFDTSGYMAAIISAIDAQRTNGASFLQPGPTAFTASPGTTSTTDTFCYDIPIAIAMKNKPTPVGLFQTALNSQETSLEVRMNPVAGTVGAPGTGLYTGNPANNTAASNTGTLDIQQIYFDPIADPASQPTLAWIHRWREWQAPLTADGDTEVRLPPSNFYLTLIYTLITGAAGALAFDSTHLTRLRLMYGGNIAPFDEPPLAVVGRQNREYGLTVPAGTYIHDFFNDDDTERDVINSAATTDLRSVFSLTGATYTGGAYARIAAEELVPLIVPAKGQAGVQGQANSPA